MATFNFETDLRYEGTDKFIQLGLHWEGQDPEEKLLFESKISHATLEKPKSNWATLGWSDNSPFNPKGSIQFSEDGNFSSKAATLEEVQTIYTFNPLGKGIHDLVKERYINFDQVAFDFDAEKFTYDDLPQLRLTVFMNPDEGALVYYQHSRKENYDDPEADIEYILPESTGPMHETANRDRLTYYFPILTGETEEVPDSPGYVRQVTKSRPTSFIVKILTFKRNPLTATELVQEALNQVNVAKLAAEGASLKFGYGKYALLKYDAVLNEFRPFTENPIDYTRRTLLLIHGTIASTNGSFGGTFKPEFGEQSYLLKRLIEHRIYDQILGFDHPTVMHDAFQNARRLYEFLEHNRFTQQIDLIGTSRGALLAKWLACDPDNRNFRVRKVMTFSGANGVAYFNFGKKINLLLKIWKKTSGPQSKFIAIIAQFSVEFILSLPGFRQMTPGSDRLKRILDSNPVSSTTRIQTVAADWNSSLPKLFFADALLDATIKLILGNKHDWVVGYNQQMISPPAYSEEPISITSMHTKNLHLNYVKENTHELIYHFLK